MRPEDAKHEAVRYVQRNFDEMLVLGALVKAAHDPDAPLTPDEQTVLRAFQRSVGSLHDAGPDEVHQYLSHLDADQIPGVVNDVKGVLHEMMFVELENGDGDTIHAELFPETNHPGYDVVLTDVDTGETWEAQLKATDSAGYVEHWISSHPHGEILVTNELAEQMHLPASGITNEGVTCDVHDFVDRLQDAPDDAPFWSHVPLLSVISLSLVAIELFRRYRCGRITASQLRRKLALATGLKAMKLAVLLVLLSIPVVNVVTATALVAKLIWSADASLNRLGRRRPGITGDSPTWSPHNRANVPRTPTCAPAGTSEGPP